MPRGRLKSIGKPRSEAGILHRSQVADVIQRGAALIRKRGFCIGAIGDDSGRLCLMGAIREAARGSPRRVKFDAYDAVNRALRRPVHEWNDEQTDGERVAELLDTVAIGIDKTLRPLSAEWVCQHGFGICPSCLIAVGCRERWCESMQGPGHRQSCRLSSAAVLPFAAAGEFPIARGPPLLWSASAVATLASLSASCPTAPGLAVRGNPMQPMGGFTP